MPRTGVHHRSEWLFTFHQNPRSPSSGIRTHFVPLRKGQQLCLHAVTGVGSVLPPDVVTTVGHFEDQTNQANAIDKLARRLAKKEEHVEEWTSKIAKWVDKLVKLGILTSLQPEDEALALERYFDTSDELHPLESLRRYRSEHWTHPLAHLEVESPRDVQGVAKSRPSIRVVLVGDCGSQMETRVLCDEAQRRGIECTAAATTPDDLELFSEMAHDVVIVGGLWARHAVAIGTTADHDGDPSKGLVQAARTIVARLREMTTAPILLNNIPIPTVQPLGFAGCGVFSHRNRFRLANLALEQLAQEFQDVYIADIESALGGVGKNRRIDDWLHSFTHLGSPGWILKNWPDASGSADDLHIPDATNLRRYIGDDTLSLERPMAAEHVDMLVSILGIDRRKCVIADLDGTLWPGVLAEEGVPFAHDLDGTVLHVFIGIHEALLALKQRGIVLAVVSKNDEATVRELWRYDESLQSYDERLLTLAAFATHRINWERKVDNIVSIARELNLALEHIVFIDDNPVERERVRQTLPDILVLGEDLFSLRRWLLSDPRLQPLSLMAESSARTQMLKAAGERERWRAKAKDETAFRDSLELVPTIGRLQASDVQRLKELFERTTQFNTTGRKFTATELMNLSRRDDAQIFTLHLKDRFGDYGLIGGCVVQAGEISALAVSCRALGIGVEHQFMDRIIAELSHHYNTLTASLVITARNVPARNIFRNHGFSEDDNNLWRVGLAPLNTEDK